MGKGRNYEERGFDVFDSVKVIVIDLGTVVIISVCRLYLEI